MCIWAIDFNNNFQKILIIRGASSDLDIPKKTLQISCGTLLKWKSKELTSAQCSAYSLRVIIVGSKCAWSRWNFSVCYFKVHISWNQWHLTKLYFWCLVPKVVDKKIEKTCPSGIARKQCNCFAAPLSSLLQREECLERTCAGLGSLLYEGYFAG